MAGSSYPRLGLSDNCVNSGIQAEGADGMVRFVRTIEPNRERTKRYRIYVDQYEAIYPAFTDLSA